MYGMVVDPLAAPCLGETGPGKRKGQSRCLRRDISDVPASIRYAPPPWVNPYHEHLSHTTVKRPRREDHAVWQRCYTAI